MATVTGTGKWISKRVHKQTWAAMANSDVGTALSAAQLADKSVQISGTFGAGGTIIIEGSNNGGVSYSTLRDPQGTALSFTAADLKQILENADLLRPRVTAGDGTTALTVAVTSESSP